MQMSSEHLKAPVSSPRREAGAKAPTDIFEALMDALASGERYRLVERGGELHLIEQGN